VKHETVRASSFAMPLSSPAFPPGPYRFVDREYFIIQYRTDPDALRRVVPEPLEVTEPVVNYEFIRMPDSTGFGDYTESGQVVPVSYKGQLGGFTHQMFLNDHPPIAGGRELWGFPKKLTSGLGAKQIIEEGFSEFFENSKSGYLFIDPKAGDLGVRKAVKTARNKVNAFVREVVKDPNVDPSHGWRHRFKTVGIEQEVAMRVLDAIQGHAPRNASEDYGDVTITAKAKAVGRFPNIDVG